MTLYNSRLDFSILLIPHHELLLFFIFVKPYFSESCVAKPQTALRPVFDGLRAYLRYPQRHVHSTLSKTVSFFPKDS